MTMLDVGTWVDVPAMWPESLHPGHLATLDLPTPYLVGDSRLLRQRLCAFESALPGVRPFYAVKCNSDQTVLSTVASHGAGFEIASLGELAMLRAVGVDPRDVLYSNTVKPAAHVRGAFEAGVWRFAIDSEGELDKIARCAPGSAVYVRVRVDDSGSVFPLSRKFGAEAHHARALLQQAHAPGAAAVRFDVPRRLAVRRDLGVGAGHVIGRPAHAPARQGRDRARDARHRWGLPCAVRRNRAVHRGDRPRGDPSRRRAPALPPGCSLQPSPGVIWSPRPP